MSEDRKAVKVGLHSQESMDVVTANVSRAVQHKQVLLIVCTVEILGRDVSTTKLEHCWTLHH